MRIGALCILFFGVMALATALGGCASGGSTLSREVRLDFTPEQIAGLATVEAAPYRLQRGDIFSLRFLYHREFDQEEVLVLPDGSAIFLGLDRVRVAGLTVTEMDSILTAHYSRQVRDADLSILMRQIAGRQVYVLGEVRQPGLYDVPVGGLGVMGAIALAGGFTDASSKGGVVVIRVTPDGYLCRELSLSSVHKGQFDAALMDLQPYDIVYVNRSAIGDFTAFSRDLIGSTLQYTRLILDVRGLVDPDKYFRR